MNRLSRLLSIFIIVYGIIPSVTASGVNNIDPYEDFNRVTHRFNETLDDYVARPAATLYHNAMPDPLEKGVVNVFRNLDEITNIFNDVLQGKFAQAVNDSGRFIINTTIGVGGLFDVAQRVGLPRSEGEDFAQTLGVWGVPDGPYIMLPFVGPSTLREAPSKFIDNFTNPYAHLDDESARHAIRAVSLASTRAELLGLDDVISGDSYLFVRDVYLQRREYLMNDGAVEDDFGDLDDY
jgi:phospholipid-binding lipoprotein MlaA